MISSEKGIPFINGYIDTKREAEEFLQNECDHLRVTIIRPGFIVDGKERVWSPYLGCFVNIAYNLNEGILQKTPLGKPLDFLFPAHTTPLQSIADIAVEAAHNKLPPQLWNNDMILDYES